jgi:vancomycin resistance protein YoaR
MKLAVCTALVLGAAAAVFPFLYMATGRMVPGAEYAGTRVSGWTQEAAGELVQSRIRTMETGSLMLYRKTEKINWNRKDFHVTCSKDKEVGRLTAIGRTGNPAERWLDFWRTVMYGKEIDPEGTFDEDILKDQVKKLAEKYSGPAVMPQPSIDGDGNVTFNDGRPHMKIDTEALEKELGDNLRAGSPSSLEIPASDEQFPKLGENEKKNINRVLSVYSTEFTPEPNRSHNIELAAKSISGTVIAPGDHFSFNETTGPRDHDHGYLDAPVFVDGKLVPDAGGGVCQVSTTLFNAVMRAGLTVTNRVNHFGIVGYAPEGQDATVSYGSIDFGFKNSRTHPVYVYTSYEPGRITVYILGNEADVPETVSIRLTDKKRIPHGRVFKTDPSLTEDKKVEEGQDGYKLTVKQEVSWKNGKKFSDTFYSVYDRVDTVITYKDASAMARAKEEWDKEMAAHPERMKEVDEMQ